MDDQLEILTALNREANRIITMEKVTATVLVAQILAFSFILFTSKHK